MKLNVLLKHKNAKMPKLGSEHAAGYDLYLAEPVTIPAGKRAVIETGVSMELPTGYVGLIWPRSKSAVKFGIQVLAGVIDSDYRGTIKVALLNSGDVPVELQTGDKAAQLVIQRHYSDFELCEVGQLSDTGRGAAGIDSTEQRLRD